MNEIIDKYTTHSKNLGKTDKQPSIDLNMRGEELEGLNVEELQQMEKNLEAGLQRVLSTKDQQFMQEISELQRKGIQLAEENMRLRDQMPQVPTAGLAVPDTENVLTEDGQSSESVMTALNSGSSQDNDDGSDISLKLGWSRQNNSY
uniref:K-box domain-containing protein n=1 Tax=Oryza barthii TaxID=65489 RepID=A0A0D3GE87_9ORYZ